MKIHLLDIIHEQVHFVVILSFCCVHVFIYMTLVCSIFYPKTSAIIYFFPQCFFLSFLTIIMVFLAKKQFLLLYFFSQPIFQTLKNMPCIEMEERQIYLYRLPLKNREYWAFFLSLSLSETFVRGVRTQAYFFSYSEKHS